MSDPFDILRDHVRRQAAQVEPETGTDELIAHITLEHHRGPSTVWPEIRRPRRRWRSVAVGVAVSLGIGAGAVVTAAVLDKQRVKVPEAGVMCRVSATDPRKGMLTDAGNDPVAACAALWNSGRLPLMDEVTEGSDPDLVACTGERGVLEVYPGSGPEVCAALGLAEADVESMLADPRRELGERASEISLACLTPRETARQAAELLDELALVGWAIVVDEGEGCGVIKIGSGDDHTLYVIRVPRPG
jgi:hypothetical protein